MIGTYLVDKVVLRKTKGTDEWQESATTVDETVRAFIEYKERRMENAAGKLTVSMAKVIMRPRDIIVGKYSTRAKKTISYEDLLIFDGRSHSVVTITKPRDFSVRSMEVYVT